MTLIHKATCPLIIHINPARCVTDFSCPGFAMFYLMANNCFPLYRKSIHDNNRFERTSWLRSWFSDQKRPRKRLTFYSAYPRNFCPSSWVISFPCLKEGLGKRELTFDLRVFGILSLAPSLMFSCVILNVGKDLERWRSAHFQKRLDMIWQYYIMSYICTPNSKWRFWKWWLKVESGSKKEKFIDKTDKQHFRDLRKIKVMKLGKRSVQVSLGRNTSMGFE